VATDVWQRFGVPDTYVEPFCGTAAVLLAAPYWPHQKVVETVNDANGFIPNAWRAIHADPNTVAHYADRPVYEPDLHAVHAALTGQRSQLAARLEGDPDYYDAKIAGWWIWGASCWIGQGFCSGRGPWSVQEDDEGFSVLVKKPSEDGVARQRQQITSNQGIFVARQKPYLSSAGQGINRSMPELASSRGVTKGVTRTTVDIYEWMGDLSERLSGVRVLCGDWSRAVTYSVTSYHGTAAIFLDPPYSDNERTDGLYSTDSMTVAHDVRKWCLTNGDNPQLRIALCGYSSEHDKLEDLGWERFEWKANGGYGNQGKSSKAKGRKNATREVIWFSPHCLKPDDGIQLSLMDELL
jgi:site-specific DNA-adenine methylase